MKYLYMLQLDYEEERDMALQAVELARQSGENLGWYMMDVASAYHHLNDTLRCLLYCDSSYQVIRQERFHRKYGKTLAYMLAMYAKHSRYERVDTLLRHLKQLPEDQRPYNYELSLAMFHEKANDTDSAILHYKTYFSRERTLSGRYEASAGLQRCYLQKGDFQQAAQWGCRLYDTNDSIIAQRAFELTQIALMNNAVTGAENVIEHFRKAAVGQAKLEEDSWKELMRAIETLHPGFHEAVQGRLQGQLREPLLRTICLLKIGMKPAEIAHVMDAKKQTAWNRIKRAEEVCGDLLAPRN